ncbi:MAG: AAA family ATPase [gamma proteobacterium symbiont of Bathyaustriella thionipta]|nr:AAA family ATPase [gamma proteobacterium symbiont of Bathyaustriella thionipta]
MAKTTVYKEPDGDHAPFLRGVLTKSLLNLGLPFNEAYDMAQTIRNDLKDTDKISTSELRKRVSAMLEQRYSKALCHIYGHKAEDVADILVETPTRTEAFSVDVLAHSLGTCAIDPQEAIHGARKVYASLKKTGHTLVHHKALRRIVYRCLSETCSKQSADRYLAWRRFENSGQPLILLICGITGSGKSTLSTELGYRLDIARMQSTDMIREVVRSYLAAPVAPTLQYSSFEAWRGLPAPIIDGEVELDNPVITGFLSQLTTLKPGLNAAIHRAITEHEHLILEGVHVLPTELNLEEANDNGIVVRVMLASLEKKILRKRLKRRGQEQDNRGSERYLNSLDEIWDLQSYLLSQADSAGISIIPNTRFKDTVKDVLDLVNLKIARKFPPDPDNMDWEA